MSGWGAVGGTHFYKMSGSGNDFVMLDGRVLDPALWTAERIVAVCDRRMGVGADGFVILTPESPRRVRMDFWNCDGSRADMCGNAALCSTRLAALLGMAPAEGMELATRAGTFPTRCRIPAGEGPGKGNGTDHEPEVAELNLPSFPVPVLPAELRLEAGERMASLGTVGVPHLVLEVADLEREGLMERGRCLRSDPSVGTAGANVNFVAPGPAGTWAVRTYERGVEGETLACGTGAVAVAAALVENRQAQFPVSILTRSGRVLRITATLDAGFATEVWLSGEGRLVFRGVL